MLLFYRNLYKSKQLEAEAQSQHGSLDFLSKLLRCINFFFSFLFPFTVKEQFPLCQRFTLRGWEQAATCNYPCSPSRGSLGAEQQLAVSFPPPLTHTYSHTPAHHTHVPPDSFPPILYIHLPSSLIYKANLQSDTNHRRIGDAQIQCSVLCNIFMHRKVISHPVWKSKHAHNVGSNKLLRNNTDSVRLGKNEIARF